MSDKVKELERQIEDLRLRIQALDEDIAPLKKQFSNLESRRARLANDLGKKKSALKQAQQHAEQAGAKPTVSDHAVIRFLERKYGFCFDDIRQELLTPAVIAAMNAGADGVKTGDGTLKIKGRTVVTFIGKKSA
ncbi:MAG: hypothetical protein ABGX08_02710 [Citromicrobium sp.]|nr:hypothetical protein [Citromicrobium sp.]|tara:strand:- start:92 stop:493 length:402 start_codon:yes stop_codon:yes gene_type:complete